MMKILVNPDWLVLMEVLPDTEFREVCLCIFNHPDRDYDHHMWRYIKKELDRNAENYKKRVSCLDKNRQKRWQSEQMETDSEQMSVQMQNSSGVIDRKEKLDINNTDKKKEIDMLVRKTAKIFSPNAPKKHLIDDDFSFKRLAENDFEFQVFYTTCSNDKLCKAEQSLKYKHFGDYFTVKQIIGWIEQEGRF